MNWLHFLINMMRASLIRHGRRTQRARNPWGSRKRAEDNLLGRRSKRAGTRAEVGAAARGGERAAVVVQAAFGCTLRSLSLSTPHSFLPLSPSHSVKMTDWQQNSHFIWRTSRFTAQANAEEDRTRPRPRPITLPLFISLTLLLSLLLLLLLLLFLALLDPSEC